MTPRPPAGSCVVVLGGGLSSDGVSLDARSPERVARGVEIFKERNRDEQRFATGTLICSGAWSLTRTDSPPRTEASLMADLAVQLGVPGEAIICEERSLDTIGNLAVVGSEILPKMDVEHVIVVSSDFHMRRVRYLVRRVWGNRWNVTFSGSVSNLSLRHRSRLVLRERRLVLLMRRLLRGIPPGDIEGCLRARPVRNAPPAM